MNNIKTQFCKENSNRIICEPSGKTLMDLEIEKELPTYIKLIE